ncbi:hypothetical protein HY490_01110 [Candidatus Woesearchaeota archaeon]|nr:hypothetical protein [Candidatus Woesearchaeota archaeon]
MPLEILVKERQRVYEVEAALSAMASVFGWSPGNVAYASTPVTSGRRMLDVFTRHKVRSADELTAIDKDAFHRDIFTPNLKEGEEFAHTLRASGAYVEVICPVTFYAKGWKQEHYILLWEQVIERFAGDIHFNSDWVYSNGCVEEFLTGAKLNKKLLEAGSPVDVRKVPERLRKAIEETAALGVDVSRLVAAYRSLELQLYKR